MSKAMNYKVKLEYKSGVYMVKSIAGPKQYVSLPNQTGAIRAGQVVDEGTASMLGQVATLTTVPSSA